MKQLTVRMKGETAEVLLYDTIGEDVFFGGVTAKEFRQQVKSVKASILNLRVNSPGGSVNEAVAMLGVLDEFKGTVLVDVDGLAASAASVVMMAGDTIRVAANALVMIHDPWTVVMGGAEDMRRTAGVLDKIREQIIDAYGRHSSAGRGQIAAWMAEETWFTGAEAVAAGLAHEVTGAVQVAACADLTRFRYKKQPPPPAYAPAAWEATRKRAAIAARL